ncbi:MAG: hypothetical protein CMJ78_10980 [Planctomycetaceae bacterium]|nr:hypothetical protein [Planctomycetaceae bacterium]
MPKAFHMRNIKTHSGYHSRSTSMEQVMRSLLFLSALLALSNLAAAADVLQDDLILWLDATQVAPDKTDGAVDRWLDRSSKHNDFSQKDAARQPVLVPNAISNRPAIRFQGKDILNRANFGGLSLGDQTFHLMIVFQAPKGGHGAQRLFDINSRVNPTAGTEKRRGFWVGFQQSRYIPRLGIHNGDEGEARSAVWDNKPHVLELVYRREQLFEIHIDGRTERKAMFNGTHFLGFHKFVSVALGQHFGMEGNQQTFYQGDIAEVLLYSRPLSTKERVDVGLHLTKKYSLKTDFELPLVFERDIRPLLAKHCFECHGSETQEAELNLRTVSSMLQGGEAGPVIVRGHPEHSELISVIESHKMPPGDDKLNREQIDLLKLWIRDDAATNENIVVKRPEGKVTAEDRQHWAWQMPEKSKPPTTSLDRHANNDIDRFVLAGLEAEKLKPSKRATPEALLRRVCLDLTGLPPTLKEIEAYLNDKSPKRFEQLIDRLMKSRHFGERWGRHWLDVAGYVGVYGSDNDAAIIKPLPGKWRYRDYVIRSFNEDKPFNQFITEQLAGDELSPWRDAERFTPTMVDSLTATGFMLSANDDTDQNELNTPDVRHHVLQRTSENVANALFAVTLQCAKCHDHKYEAISQLDYYRFESVFAPIFNVRNWKISTSRTRSDVSDQHKSEVDQRNNEITAEVKKLTTERNAIRNGRRTKLFDERLLKVPGTERAKAKAAYRIDEKKRTPEQKQLVEKYGKQLTVTDADINAGLSEDEKTQQSKIDASVTKLNSQRQSYGTIPIATESEAAATTPVLRRGNYLRPGLEVEPELFELFGRGTKPVQLASASKSGTSGRRLALAQAVTEPTTLAGQHVARVYVNRVWRQLFGRGIVKTSDNFGVSGSKPSHPQLLDWLTHWFIDNGWRVKPLIKLMVLSNTYQQTSADEGDVSLDPENVLLWRMNLRRLDSEQLRDAILTISGKLDRTLGGPPIPLDPRPDGMVVLKTSALPPGTTAYRRSVYILARRNYHMTLLRVFDQPIVARTCADRTRSAAVTQSLALLHSDFLLEQSDAFASAIAKQHADSKEQLRIAWQATLGRLPSPEELDLCTEVFSRHLKRFEGEQDAPHKALAQICHMLLNTNEFLYVP